MRAPWRRSRRVFLTVLAPFVVVVLLLVVDPVDASIHGHGPDSRREVSCGSAFGTRTADVGSNLQYAADRACEDAIWTRQNLASIILVGGLLVAAAVRKVGRPVEFETDTDDSDETATD